MTTLEKADLYLISTFKEVQCHLFFERNKNTSVFVKLSNLNFINVLSDKYTKL